MIYSGSLNINVKDIEMVLLPEKAVYLPEEKTLLISDLHIGKSRHFRDEGIAVPERLSFAELETVSSIISKIDVKRVVILGDLFHNNFNPDWNEFCSWRKNNEDIEIDLIKGNHDILSGELYKEARLNIYNETLPLNYLILLHKIPAKIKDNRPYYLAGHVHPAVRLSGEGRQKMTLPCFYFGLKYGLLPAFGRFTGTHVLHPSKSDRVYVIAKERVIQVN